MKRWTVRPNTYPQRSPRSHSRCRCRCPGSICTLSLDSCRRKATCLFGTYSGTSLRWSAGCRTGAGPGGLFTLPRGLLKNRAHCCRANEHAIPRFTFEISLSLNCAIVLASSIGQFNADPIPNREAGCADEADSALSSIGQSYNRAGGDFAARHRERKGREPTMSD